jgi:hypothetical protein
VVSTSVSHRSEGGLDENYFYARANMNVKDSNRARGASQDAQSTPFIV